MSLKEARRKASPVVTKVINNTTDPRVEGLMATIIAQNERINELSAQITALMGKNMKIDVKSGEVTVQQPKKPTSLTIEFDDGRTATVKPHYTE